MLFKRKESWLLEPKLFYFFFYATWACLSPYLSIYYKSLGYSGKAIGTLSAVTTFVGLFSGPIWAAIVDRFNKHRLILAGAILGSVAAGYAISTVRGFVAIALMVAIYSFAHSPIVALADSSVMVLLGTHKELYSRQRLWGAVGWGIAAALVGRLTERMGLNWGFYAYVVVGMVSLATALILPSSRPANKARVWHGVKELFRQPAWVIFLATLFLSGIGGSSSSGLLFLHLQDHGGSSSLMGTALTVGAFSEIIIFFLAANWLRRWGARRVLILALAVSSLRLLLISLLKTAVWILPIQLLHGVAFSLQLSASVTYVDSLAPAGFKTTSQSVYGVAGGLAGVFGSLLGGFIYDAAGSAAIFRLGSLIVAFSAIFLTAASGRKSTLPPASTAANGPSGE